MGVALSGGVALRLDQQSVETFGCCTNIMAHANIQEEEALCEYNILVLFPVNCCVLIRRQQQQLYFSCIKLVMIG